MGSHLFLLGFIFGLFHVLVAGPDTTKYAARYRSTLNCIFKNNLGGKTWLEESDIRVLKKCLKDSERTPSLTFTDLFPNKYNDRNSRKHVDEISLPMFTTVIKPNPPDIKYIWVPDDLDTLKDLRKPLLSMLLAKRNQIKSNKDQYMRKCFSEYTNFEDMDDSELRKCFQQITGFSAMEEKRHSDPNLNHSKEHLRSKHLKKPLSKGKNFNKPTHIVNRFFSKVIDLIKTGAQMFIQPDKNLQLPENHSQNNHPHNKHIKNYSEVKIPVFQSKSNEDEIKVYEGNEENIEPNDYTIYAIDNETFSNIFDNNTISSNNSSHPNIEHIKDSTEADFSVSNEDEIKVYEGNEDNLEPYDYTIYAIDNKTFSNIFDNNTISSNNSSHPNIEHIKDSTEADFSVSNEEEIKVYEGNEGDLEPYDYTIYAINNETYSNIFDINTISSNDSNEVNEVKIYTNGDINDEENNNYVIYAIDNDTYTNIFGDKNNNDKNDVDNFESNNTANVVAEKETSTDKDEDYKELKLFCPECFA